MTVKRYEPGCAYVGEEEMIVASDGDYVSYEDYAELQRKLEALVVECHSAKSLLGKIHGESYDSDHEFGKSVYEKDTNFELQDFIENQSEAGTSTPSSDAALAEIRAQGVINFVPSDEFLTELIRASNRGDSPGEYRSAMREVFASQLRKESGKS